MTLEIDFRGSETGAAERGVWLTDLHLDALDRSRYECYLHKVLDCRPDFILIGGDICNGTMAFAHLEVLAKIAAKPIYFVFGNHDFYHASISAVRRQAVEFCEKHCEITYLTASHSIPLGTSTVLIGHDGWSDARAGDFLHSQLLLNDYFLIEDFKGLNHEARKEKLHQLGDEAANDLAAKLEKVFGEGFDRVILLTHVPPFKESCLRFGLPAGDDWLPHFTSLATGEAIFKVLDRYPTRHLLILCGHAHEGKEVLLRENLRVVTGKSLLGEPQVQGVVIVN